jgi:multidrug efflux pump subunit AcrB
VTIESINYHLEQGKEVEAAIIDGASQIVVPAFVSLLCICIVFIPMFFLSGVARFPVRADGRERDVRHGLLVPAVAHAGADDGEISAARARAHVDQHARRSIEPPSKNPLVRFQRGFEARFMRLRAGYHDLLALAIEHRRLFVAGFLGFIAASSFCSRRFSAAISSRRSTAARCCCMCGRRSACVSRRPPRASPMWRRRSAR